MVLSIIWRSQILVFSSPPFRACRRVPDVQSYPRTHVSETIEEGFSMHPEIMHSKNTTDDTDLYKGVINGTPYHGITPFTRVILIHQPLHRYYARFAIADFIWLCQGPIRISLIIRHLRIVVNAPAASC